MICVAGHQPNLYPYGGFFAKVAAVDKFVIVDNTQYVRKEFHNRNRFKLQDGQAHWLSIPVKHTGRFGQAINEVEIDLNQNWAKKHQRTLSVNYKKAPYFELYFPEFEELLGRGWARLADFNLAIIRRCLALLVIDTPVLLASEEGIAGKASELIVDICRKTGADAYLHGKHSRDYVDFELMAKAGVCSFIQDFSAVEYPQTNGPFMANLSVLDLLFNCGPESRGILDKCNKVTELTP